MKKCFFTFLCISMVHFCSRGDTVSHYALRTYSEPINFFDYPEDLRGYLIVKGKIFCDIKTGLDLTFEYRNEGLKIGIMGEKSKTESSTGYYIGYLSVNKVIHVGSPRFGIIHPSLDCSKDNTFSLPKELPILISEAAWAYYFKNHNPTSQDEQCDEVFAFEYIPLLNLPRLLFERKITSNKINHLPQN